MDSSWYLCQAGTSLYGGGATLALVPNDRSFPTLRNEPSVEPANPTTMLTSSLVRQDLGSGPVGLFVFRDRTTADAQLNEFLGDVCRKAGYFGVRNKARCQLNRVAVYAAVRLWTSIERSGLSPLEG